MNQITINELYELYQDTLSKCATYLLSETDEIVGWSIYEEFDIGVHTFLHKNNLAKLYDAGLISIERMNDSTKLREKVIQLQGTYEWDIVYFRTSEKWREIMLLCDKLRY